MKFNLISSLFLGCAIFLMFSVSSISLAAKAPPAPVSTPLPSQPFTFDQPAGWTLSQSGACDTLTLYLHNSAEPLQQLFFFPRFGPVYMSQQQKYHDLQYESMSGETLTRRDMPVVSPLTPENFARFLPHILQMKDVREFIPGRPSLHVVEPISVKPQKATLTYIDSQTAIIRILFVQHNQLGEGMISLTTVPSPEFRNNPGGGIGMGYLLYGVTAPKGKLTGQMPALLAAGRSFKLSATYSKQCAKDRAEDAPALLGEANFLRPVLEALATAWEKRLPIEDMTAEKKADLMRGKERLYLPATGEVYEFSAIFSATYLKNPDLYTISGLRPLPDDPSLWLKQPADGHKIVTLKSKEKPHE